MLGKRVRRVGLILLEAEDADQPRDRARTDVVQLFANDDALLWPVIAAVEERDRTTRVQGWNR
ncbi:hypothetical protein ACFYUY_38600 [Kitasatospora sp. NPDC004745]|uniref:hypothetical protein n=1 Tax=Kitasatospora sp. NPDC004745 TaxID=3364019 RepID=UPI00368283F9